MCIRDRYIPLIQLNAEVLPAPFGPIIANKEPSSISKEISSKAWTPPKLRLTSLNEITELKIATFFFFYSALRP